MNDLRQYMEKLQLIFSSSDQLIFLVVLLTITFLPVLLCVFRKRAAVRTISLAVFAVYIVGNLSFTLLNRETVPAQAVVLQPMDDFHRAFYLDLGIIGTIRKMMTDGVSAALRTVHIGSREMAREVLLNILLYVPMGFLLPFVSKHLRNIGAVTLVGFLCSCATETAQLYFHIGYFQVDDIVCNTVGTLTGAVLGVLLAALWRVK